MKVFIFLSLSMTITFENLGPSRYRLPNSGIPSTRYLPPNDDGSSTVLTPEFHYLSTRYQNPTSPNVIPNFQYLPSNRDLVPPQGTSVVVAMQSVQYLPTVLNQPQHSSVTSTSFLTHYHHDYDTSYVIENSLTGQPLSPLSMSVIGSLKSSHSGKSDIVSSRYLPPIQRPGTFTQVIPSTNYPPLIQNQYSNEHDKIISVPVKPSVSNTYLMPGKISNSYSATDTVSHHPFNDYSDFDSFDLLFNGLHYPPSTNGYSDSFPGYNNRPNIAKYEFEYAVKDEFGNDFSHKESQNGDDTQGVYTVLLPDGRKQIVYYTANSDGFKPSITYEDTVTRQSGYDQGHKY